MYFTESQLETWKKQLNKSCTNSTYGISLSSDIVVQDFVRQISYGATVRVHRSCVIDSFECAINSVTKKDCLLFGLEKSNDVGGVNMARKRKCQTETTRRRSKRINRNVTLLKSVNYKEESEDERKEEISERSQSDEGIDILSYKSNSTNEISSSSPSSYSNTTGLVSSTPRDRSPNAPTQQNLLKSDDLSLSQNTQEIDSTYRHICFPQTVANDSSHKNDIANAKRFTQPLNHVTLQDLLKMMTEEKHGEKNPFNRSYHINGKKYIKIEPILTDQPDEIVIKLPSHNHRRAIVNLSTSNKIADMMFYPDLEEHNKRFKRSNDPSSSIVMDVTENISTTPTTTTTSTAPPTIHAQGNLYPQPTPISQGHHMQGHYAFMHPNFTIYPPNPGYTSIIPQQNNEGLLPLLLGGTPYAMPYVFIPAAATIEKPIENICINLNQPPKNVKENCSSAGKEKSYSGTAAIKDTQTVPVRVTSSNGYDSTHFVNIPNEEAAKSYITSPTQSVDLELKQSPKDRHADENKIIENLIQKPLKKKRGRPRKGPGNQIKPKKKSVVKNPRRNPTIIKLSVGHLIPKGSKEKSRQFEEEKTFKNNDSVIANLDMPSLSADSTTDNQLFENQSTIKQELCDPGVSSILNNSSIGRAITDNDHHDVQTSRTTTFANCNMQQQHKSICNMNNNIEISQTVMPLGETGENFSVSNDSKELLERFSIGEVGEMFDNLIDTSFNVHKICKEQNTLAHNKSVYSTLSEKPIITSIEKVNDFWFSENIKFNNNRENEMVSGNSTKAELTNCTEKNSPSTADLKNPTEKPSQTFCTNFSFGDVLFSQNVDNEMPSNTFHNIEEKNTPLDHNNTHQVTQQDLSINSSLTPSSDTKNEEEFTNKALGIPNSHFENNNSIEVTSNISKKFIADHSYSMQIDQILKPGGKKRMQLLKTPITTKKKSFPSWSEQTKSPLKLTSSEFSDRNVTCQVTYENAFRSDLPDEYLEYVKTPPSHNNVEEECRYIYFRPELVDQIEYAQSESNTRINSPQQINNPELIEQIKFAQSESTTRINSPQPINNPLLCLGDAHVNIKSSNVVPRSPLTTGRVTFSTSCLQESDLFLPPLELESKMENDVLDFDCNSIISAKFSTTTDGSDETELTTVNSTAPGEKKLEKEKDGFLNRLLVKCNEPSSENMPCPSIDAIPPALSSKSDLKNLSDPNDNTDSVKIIEKSEYSMQTEKFNANTEQIINVLKHVLTNENTGDPKLEEPNNELNENVINTENQDQSIVIIKPCRTVNDMAKFFNITCFPSLRQQCSKGEFCHLSHKLQDTGVVRENLRKLTMEDVRILYKFTSKHKILFFHYFNEFCFYYAENRRSDRLSEMLIDCQRYATFPFNKFTVVYNCLMDCGIDKENSCKIILKNFRRWTVHAINTVLSIIIDSDFSLFVNDVYQIIEDPNALLHASTIKKMYKSLINKPDERLLAVLYKCVFRLNMIQIEKMEKDPQMKEILIIIWQKTMALKQIQNVLACPHRRNSVQI